MSNQESKLQILMLNALIHQGAITQGHSGTFFAKGDGLRFLSDRGIEATGPVDKKMVDSKAFKAWLEDTFDQEQMKTVEFYFRDQRNNPQGPLNIRSSRPR